jgi:rhodanese-related sulfurtransferase
LASSRHSWFVSIPFVSLVILALAVLIGLGSSAASRGSLTLLPANASSTFRVVTVEEARAEHLNGHSVFLDSRSLQEYSEGHIPGAIGVSIASRNQRLGELVRTIPSASNLIVYCGGGTCQSAGALASWLLEKGWYRIAVFEAGLPKWIEAGYEVRRGEMP